MKKEFIDTRKLLLKKYDAWVAEVSGDRESMSPSDRLKLFALTLDESGDDRCTSCVIGQHFSCDGDGCYCVCPTADARRLLR